VLSPSQASVHFEDFVCMFPVIRLNQESESDGSQPDAYIHTRHIYWSALLKIENGTWGEISHCSNLWREIEHGMHEGGIEAERELQCDQNTAAFS